MSGTGPATFSIVYEFDVETRAQGIMPNCFCMNETGFRLGHPDWNGDARRRIA